MYRKGFHWSSILPTKCFMNVMWEGLVGLLRNVILASSGVLSPFLLLQCMQAATRFSQVSSPPLDFGVTWSMVKGISLLLQYWHLYRSRRSMFFLERTIFLYGTRIYTSRRTIVGNGSLEDTEKIIFESFDAISSAFPRYSRITALWTLQMLMAS